MFLAKGTACAEALGQARSCLLGPVPGLDLLGQDEDEDKQEPAQVGLVWPHLAVWVASWLWRGREGICLGEGHAPWPVGGGRAIPVEAEA